VNNIWNGAGRRIYVQEVGMRDGLQAEEVFVTTPDNVPLAKGFEAAACTHRACILSQIVKAGRRLDLHPAREGITQ
jgi:hypothetical protein